MPSHSATLRGLEWRAVPGRSEERDILKEGFQFKLPANCEFTYDTRRRILTWLSI